MTDTCVADKAAQQDVAKLRQRIKKADPETLALLLTEARTHYGWRQEEVTENQLREIYDITKMGPTSLNQQPMRIVYVKSEEAKNELAPALIEPNVEKMRTAPITAILAYDTAFYKRLPDVFPHNPNAQQMFENNPANAEINAFRNSSMQGAYFIMAVRAIGLDTGPMSGFDNAKVDEAFFSGTTFKSNFLCNLGYADETKIFRRLPRLDFDDVTKII